MGTVTKLTRPLTKVNAFWGKTTTVGTATIVSLPIGGAAIIGLDAGTLAVALHHPRQDTFVMAGADVAFSAIVQGF